MSNRAKAILTLGTFLGLLAGLAWMIAAVAGYHFGQTLLAVVGVYVAVLLLFACFRRIAWKK
jgi:hypothetical protein